MAKQHITILELSVTSTVSVSTIGAARCGRSITKNSARRIAAALSVPLENLLSDE
jgi:transcriptional regulator with XRE-family HTH domain